MLEQFKPHLDGLSPCDEHQGESEGEQDQDERARDLGRRQVIAGYLLHYPH